MKAKQIHPFEPIYDRNSRVLVLGTFPSVKSRADDFYYGHPQNRFWRVIASVTESPVPGTRAEKTALLHENGIALWDAIKSCRIKGSADSSIEEVTPNDLSEILQNSQVKSIYANGLKAAKIYTKYIYPRTGIEIVALPSTSPANAAYSVERLCAYWKRLCEVASR